MTARSRRREFAEWLPELDLYVGSRWQRAGKEPQEEDMPVITWVVDFVAEESELDVSA
jgi:hypothetical protein